MVALIKNVIEQFFVGLETWEYYSPTIDLLTIISVVLVFWFMVKVFIYFTRITRVFFGRRY